MGIEGQIAIQLVLGNGAVERVTLASSRPVHAARVFHGKRYQEALSMLPLLFSVCGIAQSCAAVRALEKALGRPASAMQDS